ncbi:SNARE associated Golgi protein-like protein [Tumidithrix helvetica PCC 7403]
MSLEIISLETIQDWAGQYGYWLIFFGIMVENSGIPIPGETITIVGGFLAGNGELSYPLVLLSAASGAMIGDSSGYWIGRLGGLSVLETVGKVFRIPSGEIAQAKEKFSGNADRAVFFGRFIALLRTFASPMAGVSGMPYPRFLLFSITGAMTWATGVTCLAYFAGRFIALEKLVSYILRFGIFILVAVASWFLLPMIWRAAKKYWGIGPVEPDITSNSAATEEPSSEKSGLSSNLNLDDAIAQSVANPPS